MIYDIIKLYEEKVVDLEETCLFEEPLLPLSVYKNDDFDFLEETPCKICGKKIEPEKLIFVIDKQTRDMKSYVHRGCVPEELEGLIYNPMLSGPGSITITASGYCIGI